MDDIIDYNTTDSSTRRKCWEIMVKPSLTKLKNTTISFWCFITVLLSHSSMMGWTDICTFVVNSISVNILEKFAMVPIEMITSRVASRNTAAALNTHATRAATGGDATAPVGPTASQIAKFKSKAMYTYILNSCDEDLQLWIGNNFSKIKEDGIILFKMLSHKIIQCTKASIRYARTSLHTMTLKDYNNNVEKVVSEMEHKIKILSCGGEEPSSVFADIFRIFSKSNNEEFRSLVQQYSRLYDEGNTYEYDWLLNTLVTKYKQLVMEGEWKEEKETPDFVAMLNKVQQENAFLKNYVMNLAKGSVPNNPSSTQGQNSKNSNPWKTTNVGPSITRNGKRFDWCQFHNKYVCSHTADKCFLNPQHPQFEEKKRQREQSATTSSKKPTLEMNLMDVKNEEYAPINPWISLASSAVPFDEHQEDIHQAILPIKQEDDTAYMSGPALSDTNDDNDKVTASHTSSFRSFSS